MTKNSQNLKSASNDTRAEFEMTCPRLNSWQVVLLMVTSFLMWWVAPITWNRLEAFDPADEFRMPHDLSNDYGMYRRLVEDVADRDSILLLGDSVMWGEYTRPGDTLAQCLSARLPGWNFSNGGVNGMHPIALEGLVRHYCEALNDQKVLVHCNLLWLSSQERDLSTQEKQTFNHQKLVPQFNHRWPFIYSSVPSYQSTLSERLKTDIERQSKFRDVVQHVRLTNFNGRDLHAWTIDHPHENPFNQISFTFSNPKTELRHRETDWQGRGLRPTAFDWIELENSRQWQSFLALLDLLEKRGNQVLVLVGPFNTHLLKPQNLERFHVLRNQVVGSLESTKSFYMAPQVLPPDLYGDASHPLAAGYKLLADRMAEHPVVRDWLNGTKN